MEDISQSDKLLHERSDSSDDISPVSDSAKDPVSASKSNRKGMEKDVELNENEIYQLCIHVPPASVLDHDNDNSNDDEKALTAHDILAKLDKFLQSHTLSYSSQSLSPINSAATSDSGINNSSANKKNNNNNNNSLLNDAEKLLHGFIALVSNRAGELSNVLEYEKFKNIIKSFSIILGFSRASISASRFCIERSLRALPPTSYSLLFTVINQFFAIGKQTMFNEESKVTESDVTIALDERKERLWLSEVLRAILYLYDAIAIRHSGNAARRKDYILYSIQQSIVDIDIGYYHQVPSILAKIVPFSSQECPQPHVGDVQHVFSFSIVELLCLFARKKVNDNNAEVNQTMTPLVAALTQSYISWLFIGNKSSPSSELLAAFTPLLSTSNILSRQIVEPFVEAISRSVKANSDSKIAALSHFSSSISFDPSHFAFDIFFTPAIKALRAPSDILRSEAAAIIKNVSALCSDQQVIKNAFGLIGESLFQGKNGTLQANIREGHVIAITSLAGFARGDKKDDEAAKPILDTIVRSIPKELNEDVRSRFLDCTVCWLKSSTTDAEIVINDLLKDLFIKGIKDSDGFVIRSMCKLIQPNGNENSQARTIALSKLLGKIMSKEVSSIAKTIKKAQGTKQPLLSSTTKIVPQHQAAIQAIQLVMLLLRSDDSSADRQPGEFSQSWLKLSNPSGGSSEDEQAARSMWSALLLDENSLIYDAALLETEQQVQVQPDSFVGPVFSEQEQNQIDLVNILDNYIYFTRPCFNLAPLVGAKQIMSTSNAIGTLALSRFSKVRDLASALLIKQSLSSKTIPEFEVALLESVRGLIMKYTRRVSQVQVINSSTSSSASSDVSEWETKIRGPFIPSPAMIKNVLGSFITSPENKLSPLSLAPAIIISHSTLLYPIEKTNSKKRLQVWRKRLRKHETSSDSYSSSTIWDRIQSQIDLSGDLKELNKNLHKTLLSQTDGLFSKSKAIRVTNQRALIAACSVRQSLMFSLLPTILPYISSEHLQSVSGPREILIWQTPVGQLAEPIQAEEKLATPSGGKPSAASASKPSHAAGKDKLDDWEKEFKDEKKAKLAKPASTAAATAGKSGSAKAAPAPAANPVAEKLEAENAIREKVETARAKSLAVIETLRFIGAGDSVVMPLRNEKLSPLMSSLSPTLFALLPNPLVGDQVMDLVRYYLKGYAGFDAVKNNSWELARFTQIMMTNQNDLNGIFVKSSSLIGSILNGVMKSCGASEPGFDPLAGVSTHLLSEPIFSFVYPVIYAILNCTKHLFQQSSFGMVSSSSEEFLESSAPDVISQGEVFEWTAASVSLISIHSAMIVEGVATKQMNSFSKALVDSIASLNSQSGIEEKPWSNPNRANTIHLLLLATSTAPGIEPSPADVMKNICRLPGNNTASLNYSELSLLCGNDGLLCSNSIVRQSVADILLDISKDINQTVNENDSLKFSLIFGQCDFESAVREPFKDIFEDIFEEKGFSFLIENNGKLWMDMLNNYGKILLSSNSSFIRDQASRAVALVIDECPEIASITVEWLISEYNTSIKNYHASIEAKQKVKPKFVQRGEEAELPPDASLSFRWGIASCFSAFATLGNAFGQGSSSSSGGGALSASSSDGSQTDSSYGVPASPGSGVLDKSSFINSLKFIVNFGLFDHDQTVRNDMLRSGSLLLQAYGKDETESIIATLEKSLTTKAADPKNEAAQREGVIVLLGAAATFLSADDPKVQRVLDSLIEALKTSGEAVQQIIAQSLPSLSKSVGPQKGGDILNKMILRVLSTKPIPRLERKGLALGIASIVKGIGVASLKQHDVIGALERAASEDNNEAKQGALFVYGSLSTTLGMLFEPYVISILPILLKCASDPKMEVRNTAHESAKMIMGKLSGPGVKLVLPALLKAVSDSAWRTKESALQLLGLTAYCAPKQLGSCLPQVVPCLVESFGDTHVKVREAARSALEDIGSVIRNPEIQSLVPALMDALTNPNEKLQDAIDKLKATHFVNNIDAASLALIVPLLDRGLKQRSTDMKKKSAQIAGGICSMVTDAKSIQPYLEVLLPILKDVLVDPIPGVRSTSAKALGTLTRGLGEQGIPNFEQLLQWLIETMRSDTSTVERSGAAQGLMEVIAALGSPRMDEILENEVFSNAEDENENIREGVIWVLVFLPHSLGREESGRYCSRSLETVVRGLADEWEPVRDASMRAGQVIVGQHALSHALELLPTLQDGLEDESWRIRQCSVKLLGDLLDRLATAQRSAAASGSNQAVFGGRKAMVLANAGIDGFSGVVGMVTGTRVEHADDVDEEEMEKEEEDDAEDDEEGENNNANEMSMSDIMQYRLSGVETYADIAMLRAFGAERRNSIIASLYLLRFDSSAVVKQSAYSVWKVIIINGPRTLRKIMPTLMDAIIVGLASDDPERRESCGRTLGEIVLKLGDRVLPEIMPVIRTGLESDLESTRIGVAFGLAEIVQSASKTQIEHYLQDILPSLQLALCDESDEAREAGARSFNRLYNLAGGEKLLQNVLNHLLNEIDGESTSETEDDDEDKAENDEEHDRSSPFARALEGLRSILQRRSREVMPLLLPRILASPITIPHVKAIEVVCESVPENLHHYVRMFVRSFIRELSTSGIGSGNAPTSEVTVWNAVTSFTSNIDAEGVQSLLLELIDQINAYTNEDENRRATLAILTSFCANSSGKLDDYLQLVIKTIIKQLADPYTPALQEAWDGMDALVASQGAEELSLHLSFIRNQIGNTASIAKHRKVPASTSAAASSSDNSAKANEYYLPAFSLPKGLAPLLGVYQHALLHGTPEQRADAAEAIREMVELTELAALKPYIVKITGPLIRIVGDRFPPEVKSAILATLGLLLTKGEVHLRPFLPQLQTSFVKSLHNESSKVRNGAAVALEKLVAISPRLDPLIVELGNVVWTIKTDYDKSVAKSLLNKVISKAEGKNCDKLVASLAQIEAEQPSVMIQ